MISLRFMKHFIHTDTTIHYRIPEMLGWNEFKIGVLWLTELSY